MSERPSEKALGAIEALYADGRDSGIFAATGKVDEETSKPIVTKAREAEAAIRATFERADLLEQILRKAAEWTAQSCDCPHDWNPIGWADMQEEVCIGYADDDDGTQFVCEQTQEQMASCWEKFWAKLAEAERGPKEESDGQ